MARGVRERMVASAVDLLARRGLQSTSFSEVLERSGAPRGSIYHHFPDGKDQMVGAALDAAGGRAIELLDRKAGAPAEEVATWFLHIWREVLIRGRFEAGCAVLAVAVAADSPELLDQTARVFRAWRGRLAELLEQGGLRADDAQRFAALLVASSEGAVVLARAEQSLEPFDLVADQLLDQVRALARPAR
ncbi:MAG: TetR/AcrR family transcriptional regulator, lmrAB and yxaGH operons repressor [Chloroflexota bacterium]|nr:TetR/AcrR family transcriptional regulator, lmrAB and yxaGH operons repressor [Chloroflexota bacterium]